MATDDFPLLKAWRNGDRQAADRLFHRYFAAVARFFRSKLGEGFEDLVQQTFLRAIEGRDRFRCGSSYRTYLYATARNVLREELRRRGRVERRRSGQALTSLVDPGADPAEALASARAQKQVFEALGRLALEQRVALGLYHYEDLTGPEIAELLAITEPAVRSRLRRATVRLLCLLDEVASSRCDEVARDPKESFGPEDRSSTRGH